MKSASLFLLACAAVVTPLRAAEPSKPNILLLFADDQRADTIHALGNPVINTPNLDRLVHRGLSFDRAYMQGGMQGATCVPSRAMLLSGQNLFHIDEQLLSDATWPEAFGKAGYATFISGKWHNGNASLVRSFKIARGIFTGGMTDPMQAELHDVTAGKVGEMMVRDEKLLPWPRPPNQVRKLIAEYYRYISYLDLQIGRVLDALAASPFAEQTIIVFTADSGVARGSHGLIGKQSVYEYDSVRVPLIIAGPGIAANEHSNAMVYLFDILPTLGKRCGIASPNRGDGMDVSATLKNPAMPARDRMMFAYRDVQRGYTDGRWKLIRYPRVDRTQLFDLQSDPHEAVNLADKPDHAARVVELTTALTKEMKASGDNAPLKIAKPEPAAWTPPADARQGRSADDKKPRA
jgi:arylsulfatase A-like enzyme